MTQRSDLQEVKKNIRAVLNSSQQVLTARDLYRDYKELIGSEIPHRALGFRFIVDFLRSIPDTVQISGPYNDNPLLSLVEDNKTSHIAKLVTCQKTNTKSTRRRPKRSTAVGRNYKSTISIEFKKKLWNILSHFPNGMLLRHFKQKVEELIPLHLSYQFPVEEIISSISNIARVDGNMISLLPEARRNENIVSEVPVDRCSSPENDLMVPSDSDPESDVDNYNESPSKKRVTDRQQLPNKDFDDDDADSDGHPCDNNMLMSQTLKKNLQALFEEDENQNGIWAEDLEDKYLKKFGYKLPLATHGCPEVISLVANLPDVVSLHRYQMAGSYMLNDARKFPNSKNKGASCPEIPIALLREIKTLLRKKDKKSVYSDELPHMYQRLFHKTLSFKDYGFNNYDEFLRSLDQCEEIVFCNSQHRTILSLSEQQPNETTNTDAEDASVDFPSYDPFPPGVCGANDRLDPNPLLAEFQSGAKVVRTSEIYTPGRFFLQFEENIAALNRMMDDLNIFYTDHQESYEVLPRVLKRGLLCTCTYSADGKWHRVSLINNDLVRARVKYVDYGTVEDVKVADLRYLRRDYAMLPALCFRAKLPGIRPRKDSLVTEGEMKYSRDVCTDFYEYVNNKDLRAELVEVQSETYTVNLTLSVDGRSVSVKQVLIDKNLVEADANGARSEVSTKKVKKLSPKSMLSKVANTPKSVTETMPTAVENTDELSSIAELASSVPELTSSIPELSTPASLPPASSSQPFLAGYPINNDLSRPKAGPPPGLNYASSLPQATNYASSLPQATNYASSLPQTINYASSLPQPTKYHPPSNYVSGSSFLNLPTIASQPMSPFYGQHYAAPAYGGSRLYAPISSAYIAPPQPQIPFASPYATDVTYSYSLVQPRMPVPAAFVNVRPPPGLGPVYQASTPPGFAPSTPPGFVPSAARYATPSYPLVTGQVAPASTVAPFSYASSVTGQAVYASEPSKNLVNGWDEKRVEAPKAAAKVSKPAINVEQLTSNLKNINVCEKSANVETSSTKVYTLQDEKIREKVNVENTVKQYFLTSFENLVKMPEKIEKENDLSGGKSKLRDKENNLIESVNIPRQKSVEKVVNEKTYTALVNGDSAAPQSMPLSNNFESKTSAVDDSSKKNIKLNPIRQFVLQHEKQTLC